MPRAQFASVGEKTLVILDHLHDEDRWPVAAFAAIAEAHPDRVGLVVMDHGTAELDAAMIDKLITAGWDKRGVV